MKFKIFFITLMCQILLIGQNAYTEPEDIDSSIKYVITSCFALCKSNPEYQVVGSSQAIDEERLYKYLHSDSGVQDLQKELAEIGLARVSGLDNAQILINHLYSSSKKRTNVKIDLLLQWGKSEEFRAYCQKYNIIDNAKKWAEIEGNKAQFKDYNVDEQKEKWLNEEPFREYCRIQAVSGDLEKVDTIEQMQRLSDEDRPSDYDDELTYEQIGIWEKFKSEFKDERSSAYKDMNYKANEPISSEQEKKLERLKSAFRGACDNIEKQTPALLLEISAHASVASR